MHATHLTPIMEPNKVFGVTEQAYKAYPLRRDSLAAYSYVVQGMINKVLPARLRPDITLDDVIAARYSTKKLPLPSSVPPRRPN